MTGRAPYQHPARVIAVDANGVELRGDQRPASVARDQFGCFKGCRWSGCEATQCRSIRGEGKLGNFTWVLHDDLRIDANGDLVKL